MTVRIFVADILHKLGVCSKYKGYEYILSCIEYMDNNVEYFPITKVLYVDISKQFHTSVLSIEHGIRNAINIIWKNKSYNEELIKEIFGEYNIRHKPTNLEFLSCLYDYMDSNIEIEPIEEIKTSKKEVEFFRKCLDELMRLYLKQLSE